MIKVEHLTKYYGDFLAVNDLSFEIDEGHVYGFLGPNGAGKTTTMNIMTGCLSATSGHVQIGGFDIFEDPDHAKRLIGYLPEQPPLYMNETPLEYLRFVGEAKGLKGAELKQQVDKVIEQVKIQNVKGKRISALSKGYKQRILEDHDILPRYYICYSYTHPVHRAFAAQRCRRQRSSFTVHYHIQKRRLCGSSFCDERSYPYISSFVR